MTLYTKVRRFLDDTGMTASRFGRDAMKDPSFMLRLKPDSAPRRKTVERCEAFMAQYLLEKNGDK